MYIQGSSLQVFVIARLIVSHFNVSGDIQGAKIAELNVGPAHTLPTYEICTYGLCEATHLTM